jgi:D-Tyr-tRNAtyr deacylase
MRMKEAKAGDVLTDETARMNMICTDLEGDKVVISGFVDHKTCEIGDWSDYTQSFLYHH